MKGKVLTFNLKNSEGIILGDDGNRYKFTNLDWENSDIHPSENLEVDFEIHEDCAKAIYILKKEVSTNAFEEEFKGYFNYYLDAVKNKYAQFDGRASRTQFWYFQLFNFIIAFLLGIISAGLLSTIYALAVLVPNLAIGCRRLHDVNKSGWWQLLLLIPFGVIVLIIFWVGETKSEKNKYDV